MALLPLSATDEQCELITDESLWPGVRTLCADLGYAPERLTKFTEGSLPVYDLDDELVLKLYPAADLADLATEPVMRALHGRLPIPTPEVVATGRFDGWGYLLMTKLRGTDLRPQCPQIDRDAKLPLARQAGEALAALHAVPAPPIGPAGWTAFIDGQIATAADRQRHRARPLAAPALARRLMAYAMLHRFAHLPWYFKTVPAPGARTFEAVAGAWFGI
jgi:hygromycin-B 7''-O-kinase